MALHVCVELMTDAQQEVRSAVQWWVVVVMAGQDYWAGLHGWLDGTTGQDCMGGWTGLEGRFL